jgi:hypothetical protein
VWPELAECVGARLGIEGEELVQLRHAAALHDIGKVAIPDEIIAKPGPLDDEEWAFMRRHTIIGERIIAAAPALGAAARLVRSSHEAWGGGGYPDGLAGEDIALGARVVAVCDAFDAMISQRPYAPARTVEEALAELRPLRRHPVRSGRRRGLRGRLRRAGEEPHGHLTQNSVSIQSIIERSCLPSRSIWWSACSSRMRLKFSWPARFSAIHSRANAPDWISPRISFIAARVGRR